MSQATAEDRTAITNLTTAIRTLIEQVALYSNRLSTKEVDNMTLHTAVRNLQGKLKKLKAEIQNFKKSGHSGAAGAAYKNNGRMVPNWKK